MAVRPRPPPPPPPPGANITSRFISYVSPEALSYGFRAGAKAFLACML